MIRQVVGTALTIVLLPGILLLTVVLLVATVLARVLAGLLGKQHDRVEEAFDE